MAPNLETLPYVGLRPTTPQYDAGCLMDPPVSVPRANKTSPEATAAAEPADDPPGSQLRSLGFLVGQ